MRLNEITKGVCVENNQGSRTAHMADQHFEVGVKRKKEQRRLGERDQ